MNSQIAQKLVNKLREKCPVDTGQLRLSIQMIQLDERNWEVLIGNASGNINGIPSEQYASITNFSRTLVGSGRRNPNYHWINDAIKEWATENMIQFQLEDDEDEE